jgi:hypothetical protein
MPVAAAVLLTFVAALVTVALRGSWLQRLPWGLSLRRRMDRSYLLGLRRLLRNLLAMGPVPGPVDQRLLLKVQSVAGGLSAAPRTFPFTCSGVYSVALPPTDAKGRRAL